MCLQVTEECHSLVENVLLNAVNESWQVSSRPIRPSPRPIPDSFSVPLCVNS